MTCPTCEGSFVDVPKEITAAMSAAFAGVAAVLKIEACAEGCAVMRATIQMPNPIPNLTGGDSNS